MSTTKELEQSPTDAGATTPPLPRREKTRSWFREHPVAIVAVVLVLGLAVIGGLWAWNYYSARESTDDARIDGHIAPVSARVGGTVIEILVDENDTVQAQQIMARLDDRDYRIALQRAEADLAAQNAAARAARTQVPIASTSTTSGLSGAQSAELEAQAGVSAAAQAVRNAQARVTSAEANLRAAVANRDRAVKDVERYKSLVERDEISRQQFEAAVTTATAAQAEVESAQAAVAQARSGVAAAESQRRQAEARVA